EEVLSSVCRLFCQGVPPSHMPEQIKQLHGVEIGREGGWKLLALAAREGRFHYQAPGETELTVAPQERYPRALQRVRVVHSAVIEDVAQHAAALLLEMVCEPPAGGDPGEERHLGLAGGNAVHLLSRTFSRLISSPVPGLPRSLVFHALVGGILEAPLKSPITCIHFCASNPALQPTGFVGLCAPEVVRATDYDHLRNCAGIKEAFDRRGELQIIVTAAGRWECGHSTFYEMLDRHAPAS